ncbi:thioredoxin domain-containing protein [Burkholderia sp. MBR-1]|uniref:thioredoxin domain-containing protein n=1 Tax=Burkholderia sp. MBR-1 TaxID=2732364 RepID=UPI0015EEC117|nr:thioredoxin domain-containing protein [Burkholderia sp. MBR-1]QMI49766.1 thioredoxin domain-containing protein [Burkholderia sp. MBR-1]
MKLTRRTFLAAAGGVLMVARSVGTARAQNSSAGAPGAIASDIERNLTPYLVIGDYKEDYGKVFMFFMFTCPYCQANWRALTGWGATLPKSYRFVDVPIIEDTPDSRAAALAFYTVKALAPSRLLEFKAAAYTRAQQGRARSDDYAAILREMRLSGDDITKYLKTVEMRSRIDRALQLAGRYSVEVTPSFGIGGQYQTNANFTNGDYALLARLMGGLVSRQIEQRLVKR